MYVVVFVVVPVVVAVIVAVVLPKEQLRCIILLLRVPAGSPSRGGDVTVYV